MVLVEKVMRYTAPKVCQTKGACSHDYRRFYHRPVLPRGRWIVGGKLCFVLNHLRLIVDWDVDTANVFSLRSACKTGTKGY